MKVQLWELSIQRVLLTFPIQVFQKPQGVQVGVGATPRSAMSRNHAGWTGKSDKTKARQEGTKTTPSQSQLNLQSLVSVNQP
eukprot:3888281-Amphidinium_carterae.1